MYVDRFIPRQKRLGLGEQGLDCGFQMSSNQDVAKALILKNSPATRAHNNCSGRVLGKAQVASNLLF
jgi:L-asparaginase II